MTKTIISISNIIKLTSFAVSVVLSLAVVIMCIIKLCGHLDESDKALYVALMSSIVSIWLPSPSAVLNIKTKELATAADEEAAQ